MTLLEAYEAIVQRGAAPELSARVAELRSAFEQRTGKYTPEDAWFEARSRAFWDDAVTAHGFAEEAAAHLGEDVRALVPAFTRAHRGLFVIDANSPRGVHALRDVWSGAEFVVDEIDEGMRDALAAASAPFDARVVATLTAGRVHAALLPGAVFHPADANEPIPGVLQAARAQGLSTESTLDALLRMERALRSLSRMKAGYAYRASALAPAKQ